MQVFDKGMSYVSCKDVPKFRRSIVLPSMFPNGGSYQDVVKSNSNCNISIGDEIADDVNGNSDDGVQEVENPMMHDITEVSALPLDRCVRLVPHDQNTGAFFIAVLQKVSPLPGNFSDDLCCFFSLSEIIIKRIKEFDKHWE